MTQHPVSVILRKHEEGQPVGLYCVCSANGFVLEAAMAQAQADDSVVLIESTSNQVDADQLPMLSDVAPLRVIPLPEAKVISHGVPSLSCQY